MNAKRNSILGFFLVFLAGSALGFLVGAYTGSNFGMGLIANNALRKDALDVDRQLQALRQLRSGATPEAIEIIEAGIDDTLVIFDPHEPIPGVNADTEARVNDAIRAVFDYRREYPRSSDRPHVDVMLNNLFKRKNLE